MVPCCTIKNYATLFDSDNQPFHCGVVHSETPMEKGSRFYLRGKMYEVFEVLKNYQSGNVIHAVNVPKPDREE